MNSTKKSAFAIVVINTGRMEYYMNLKVGMVSLGCSKNQVDAEIMLSLVREKGFTIESDAGLCDVVIINTCGFIEDAKKESIENILEFCTLKKEGKVKVVVVTGCLAERYKDEVAKEIPEADVVLGIGKNADIVDAIERSLAGEKVISFGDKNDLPLSGKRILTNLPFFAYVKVADGCDNACTFCAIPMIRGNFRSRKMEDILEEIQYFAQNGVKEINLVAQDTTRYGEDIYNKIMLPELLKETCKIDGIEWVRILYAYPERMTDELLDVMASEPKIVKYIDIPIQHASGKVLKMMNRSGNYQELKELMVKIRTKIPNVALRTTLIAGFPGETQEDFEELCNFVKEVKFDRLGCFTYSPEEDTPASRIKDQIEDAVKVRRSEIIMSEQYGIMEEKNKAMIGTTLKVVVEGFDRIAGTYFGRSYMDAPDVDTKTFFTSDKKLKIGEFVTVLIQSVLDYDLVGKVN